MPYFTKYHVSEQSAPVLLAPIRETLLELEKRTRNYVERVHLHPGTGETLSAAHAALVQAREEIERLAGNSAGSKGNSNG